MQYETPLLKVKLSDVVIFFIQVLTKLSPLLFQIVHSINGCIRNLRVMGGPVSTKSAVTGKSLNTLSNWFGYLSFAPN